MDYSFNDEIAKVYGVEAAVFIHNLYWWIRKNEVNGRHFYEGRTWTYNSMRAFTQLFPFWTHRQIERIIRKLKDDGALIVGNFNPSGFNRTQWYTLDDSIYSHYANPSAHFTERVNQISPNGDFSIHQTVKPISDSKPYNEPDKKENTLPIGRVQKKSAYGEFENVLLADVERKKLDDKLGDVCASEYIEKLSAYLAQTGRRYKSHYATVLNWWNKDGNPVKRTPKPVEVKPDRLRKITPDMSVDEIF